MLVLMGIILQGITVMLPMVQVMDTGHMAILDIGLIIADLRLIVITDIGPGVTDGTAVNIGGAMTAADQAYALAGGISLKAEVPSAEFPAEGAIRVIEALLEAALAPVVAGPPVGLAAVDGADSLAVLIKSAFTQIRDAMPPAKTCSQTEIFKMIQTLKSLMLLLLLASCSSIPGGPSVLVLPGADKDFIQFHNDDVNCRQYAWSQIESSKYKPNSDEEGQQLYDIGFIQCMYGKGHRVPVPEHILFDSFQEWEKSLMPELEPPQ